MMDGYASKACPDMVFEPSPTPQPYQFVGELGYHTHWQDANLTLLQLRVRFYDPQVGRFGQRDPIKDGMDGYIYASNKPTVRIDPSGLCDKKPYKPGKEQCDGKSIDFNCTGCNGYYLNQCIEDCTKRFRKWKDYFKKCACMGVCKEVATICESFCTRHSTDDKEVQAFWINCCWAVAKAAMAESKDKDKAVQEVERLCGKRWRR